MRLHATALLAWALACTLAGCSSAEDIEEATGTERETTARASASTDSEAGGARAVSESNDVFEFDYSYPVEAGRIAELRAMLDRRLEQGRTELVEQAGAAKEEAQSSGFPFNPHGLHVEWSRVADLPRWLSLSAKIATFSGGAHGNVGYDSLVWDKREGTAMEPLDFFVSRAAFARAVESRWCAALNEEREERRGQAVSPDGEDMFDKCPGIDELTVLLGSSNGKTFDRIGLIAAPYVAGSYAEGVYEVTLPVDMAVLDAVKKQYDADFSLKR